MGVYTLYAGMTGTIFATYPETLQALQGALIFSAAFFLFLVFLKSLIGLRLYLRRLSQVFICCYLLCS